MEKNIAVSAVDLHVYATGELSSFDKYNGYTYKGCFF